MRVADVKPSLTYPAHPFPPALCLKITAFPRGFQELALARKLSIECINFVHLIVLTSKAGYEVPTHLTLVSDKLLGESRLTTLERLLVSTLSSYDIYVSSERQVASPNPAWSMYVDQQVEKSVSSDSLNLDTDLTDWTCLMLRATTGKNTASWHWADAQLQKRIMSDDRREKLEKDFISIPRHASSLTTSDSDNVATQRLLPL